MTYIDLINRFWDINRTAPSLVFLYPRCQIRHILPDSFNIFAYYSNSSKNSL